MTTQQKIGFPLSMVTYKNRLHLHAYCNFRIPKHYVSTISYLKINFHTLEASLMPQATANSISKYENK